MIAAEQVPEAFTNIGVETIPNELHGALLRLLLVDVAQPPRLPGGISLGSGRLRIVGAILPWQQPGSQRPRDRPGQGQTASTRILDMPAFDIGARLV